MRILLLVVGLCLSIASPTAEHVVVPDEQWTAAVAAARQYGVKAQMTHAVIVAADRHLVSRRVALQLTYVESRFVPTAVSPTKARGLTQVLLSTAKDIRPRTTVADLHDPYINADIGMHYYRQLYDRYRGNEWLALVAYNAGMRTADSLQRQYRYAHIILQH